MEAAGSFIDIELYSTKIAKAHSVRKSKMATMAAILKKSFFFASFPEPKGQLT